MSARNAVVATLIGAGVILLGIILQQIAVIPAFLLDPAVALNPAEASRLGVIVMLPLNFIGLGAAGVVYMAVAGKGWDWIDLRRPGRSDLVWMVGGAILGILALLIIGVLAQSLNAEPPEQALTALIQEDILLIVYMIAIVWLFNAPVEEFVFRNVVQKRLYDAFSGVGAVVLTSLLFASIHILTFVFVGQAAVDVLFPILGIFVGSLLMGFAYLRTENLYVPIVIHGLFNSFQLVILLLVRLLDIDPEAAASLVGVALSLL